MYSSTYQYTVQLRSFVSESAKEKKKEKSNIVIYDGFMMEPWENRRQKSIVVMSIMNHEQEQRPKYITMIIRFSDGGFHDTNFTC